MKGKVPYNATIKTPISRTPFYPTCPMLCLLWSQGLQTLHSLFNVALSELHRDLPVISNWVPPTSEQAPGWALGSGDIVGRGWLAFFHTSLIQNEGISSARMIFIGSLMTSKVFPGQLQWDFRIVLKRDIAISLWVASKAISPGSQQIYACHSRCSFPPIC